MSVFSSGFTSLFSLFNLIPSLGDKYILYVEGSRMYNLSPDLLFEHETHISNCLFSISTWTFHGHLKLNLFKANSDLSKLDIVSVFTTFVNSTSIHSNSKVSLINNVQSITKPVDATSKIHLEYPKYTLNIYISNIYAT